MRGMAYGVFDLDILPALLYRLTPVIKLLQELVGQLVEFVVGDVHRDEIGCILPLGRAWVLRIGHDA